MKARSGKKLHPTGQLSIFAILIFQVLFILFAMSLNIALVVHDKINLQNSVDIAAYYGAMKQAEMMNAIAHINYQIRQSWKLLTWRYRVLGSVGITDIIHPPLRPAKNSDSEHHLPSLDPPTKEGPYFFCMGHKHWGVLIDPITSAPRPASITGNDNLCLPMDGDPISAPSIPVVTGTLGGFSPMLRGVRNMAITVGIKLRKKCNLYGYNSWLFGIMSFIRFRRDQSARKYMIHELAEVMSGNKFGHPHGTDMDKGSIAKGVEKTFEKNLSFINKTSYRNSTKKLKQFNSLEKVAPDKWLSDQPFYDLGLYSNTYGTTANCTKKLTYLTDLPQEIASDPTANAKAQALINEIGFLAPHQPWPACAVGSKSCLPSAGLRKINNFIVFYSVKAELDYEKQIFLPFSTDIILKAKAFAKPFGGRIGPNTEGPHSVDKRLPKSSLPPTFLPIDVDKLHNPNYSRYPGDEWGLRSEVVHYHWAKYIKSTPAENNILNYLKIEYPDDNDPLARNYLPGLDMDPYVTARGWDVAAVAPDLFDVTYFTILPYYTEAYFPKVYNLISDKNYLRGDLGRYRTPTGWSGSSILKQVGYGSTPDKNIWRKIPDYASKPTKYSGFIRPFYKINSLNLLLTGWNPPKQKYRPGDNDYEAASSKTNFGKCFLWAHDAGIVLDSNDTRGKIANGCIYGGRTGYSVKMISTEFLRRIISPTNSFPTGDPEWF